MCLKEEDSLNSELTAEKLNTADLKATTKEIFDRKVNKELN